MKTQESVWMKALDVVLVGGLFLVASGIILGGTVLAGVLLGGWAAFVVFCFFAGMVLSIAVSAIEPTLAEPISQFWWSLAWMLLILGSGGSRGGSNA